MSGALHPATRWGTIFWAILAMLSGGTLATTAKAQYSLDKKRVAKTTYSSAFADADRVDTGVNQDQEAPEADPMFDDGPTPKVDPAALRTLKIDPKPPEPVAKDLLAPVNLKSSFPARVQVGKVGGYVPWTQMPRGLTMPKPLWKKLKLGSCVFTLKTSEFVLNNYYYDSENRLAMGEDSIAQRTTFKMAPYGKFYASLAAIIKAENDTPYNKECRKKLRGKRFYLGQADLTGTLLESLSRDNERGIAYKEQVGTGQKLFLTWSDNLGQIEVVNEAGIPPAVESDVFRISLPASGVHYLGASTNWTIQR